MRKKFMRTIFVLLILSFIYPTSPVFSEIYKWVDKNGTVSYSDTPPAGQGDVVIIDTTTEPSSTNSPETTTDYSDSSSQKQPPINTPTKRHQVDLYVTNWCPYCKKAENFFKSRNIEVSIYDIEKNKTARRRKEKLDGRKGVPFAVINGKKIHGYDEYLYLKALNR